MIRTCKKCGFILGTRPDLKEKKGICQACLNSEKKNAINFEERQKWLTDYIQKNKGEGEYDALIAVSGGKDSHTITNRLIENHGLKNPLLVTVLDEFTRTKAGAYNLKNLAEYYDLDHIYFRSKPKTFIKETLKDFEKELHPLKWIEERIYSVPLDIAKRFGIKLLFFGENGAFEYGSSEKLDIFHPATDKETKIIFMGAIYPYSIDDSLNIARSMGFKDLNDFNEWPRQGSIENYTQIDSIGYIIQLWTKFVKFGFQRVSDIACRFVRDNKITKEQATLYIKDKDYICDPMAKKDFCKTIGISEKYFDEIVDKHANKKIVKKDVNGNWRRIDFIS